MKPVNIIPLFIHFFFMCNFPVFFLIQNFRPQLLFDAHFHSLSLLSHSKETSQQRVKKWGFSLEEALKDPLGRDLFLKFLESEFSSENLRWGGEDVFNYSATRW